MEGVASVTKRAQRGFGAEDARERTLEWRRSAHQAERGQGGRAPRFFAERSENSGGWRLFHPLASPLFFRGRQSLDFPPMFLVGIISVQVSISGNTKSVCRRPLGVALPVPALLILPAYGGGAFQNSFYDIFPSVPVGTHAERNHGIHPRSVLNSHVLADVGQMGLVRRERISGPQSPEYGCFTGGRLVFFRLEQGSIFRVDPAGQFQGGETYPR